jgi:phage terminase large subunit-like protein
MVCIHEADPSDDLTEPAVQKKANPSLGHTISAEDLNSDIVSARVSPRELIALKRYRFNIWASRTAPWLDMSAWDACRSEVSDEALEGLPCVGGLDLALKHDMSALALIFIDEDCCHLRTWAWLPEARVKALQGFVSLQEWSDAGWLKITGENVVDFKVIEDDVCELFERFTPRQWAYDVKYAPDLARRIEERTKTEPVEFGQSMVNFAGPTLKLEQMVNAHSIRHNNNGLINWQISNVHVKPDYDQNIRPVRPDRNDHKTIDTVVAAVMALGLVTAADEVNDYYDDHVLEMG